jgi:hypothetical protein
VTPHALLDNVMWHCLSGPHAKFATGSGENTNEVKSEPSRDKRTSLGQVRMYFER